LNKMPNKILKYSKALDGRVLEAVEEVTKVESVRAVRIIQGVVNYVYKVETKNGNYLVRVFRTREWLKDGKLKWIEGQLAKKNIPHSKTLFYTRDNKYFPFGFMINEFLEGPDAKIAGNRLKKLSLHKAFYEVGKILRKVHSIKIKKYGEINNGYGTYKDFITWKLEQEVWTPLKEFNGKYGLSVKLYPEIEKIVRSCLQPFIRTFRPVLVHCDANRENAIWTKDGRYILVDWDNAYSSIWLNDLTELTFWTDHFKSKKQAATRRNIILKSFLAGYGNVSFSLKQIETMEYALHLIKCVHLMAIYHFALKDDVSFMRVKDKFFGMLEKNRMFDTMNG
jgi:Ser/Thr protein kinase RdoA (MazF antagonist)